MKIIWRDIHWLRLFFIITCIIIDIGIIYLLIFDFNPFGLIISIVPLFLTILLFRYKLTYITSEGIRIGNAPDDTYGKIKLMNSSFLSWKEIKEIKIINHQVSRNICWIIKPFISIKSKKGRRYECFIANPKGFSNALEKLHKSSLLKNN